MGGGARRAAERVRWNERGDTASRGVPQTATVFESRAYLYLASAAVRISTAVHAHAHALDPLDDRRLRHFHRPHPTPPDTALPISPPHPTGAHRADNNNNDDAAAAVCHVQAAPAPVCREGSRAVFTSARGRHVSEIFSSTHAHADAHIVVAAATASSSSSSSFFGRRISYRRCTRPPPRCRYRRSPFAVDGAAVDPR
ncbi:hypothetical protein QTP88_019503 [Uroleucon formosanum]